MGMQAYQRFIEAFDACPDRSFKLALRSPPWYASEEHWQQWCYDTARALEFHSLFVERFDMSIKFTSIGHFFAAAVSDVQKAETFLKTKVEGAIGSIADKATDVTTGEQQVIETLTSLIPGIGFQAANFERAIFAASGPVLALANDAVHGAEQIASDAEAKLLALVQDQSIVDDLKSFIQSIGSAAAAIGYDFKAAATQGAKNAVAAAAAPSAPPATSATSATETAQSANE